MPRGQHAALLDLVRGQRDGLEAAPDHLDLIPVDADLGDPAGWAAGRGRPAHRSYRAGSAVETSGFGVDVRAQREDRTRRGEGARHDDADFTPQKPC